MNLNEKLGRKKDLADAPKSEVKIERPRVELKKIPKTEEESSVLEVIKEQFNILYKALMRLLMEAVTLKSKKNEVFYKILASDFGMFEREFNGLMMNISEAVESREEGRGFFSRMGNMIGRHGQKLFSCVPNTDSSKIVRDIQYREAHSMNRG